MFGRNKPDFAEALRSEMEASSYRGFIEGMTILDLSQDLGPEQYLVYDGHMAPAGHLVVAEHICRVIGCPLRGVAR